MIQQQNVKVLSTLGAAETASSGTATLTIDTSGFDHASIGVVRSSNAATSTACIVGINATLSRSEDALAVATDAGVVSWVRG